MLTKIPENINENVLNLNEILKQNVNFKFYERKGCIGCRVKTPILCKLLSAKIHGPAKRVLKIRMRFEDQTQAWYLTASGGFISKFSDTKGIKNPTVSENGNYIRIL